MNQRIQPHVFPKIPPREPVIKNKQQRNGSFGQVLQREISRSEELKVSRHAQERLNERNISIDKEQWQSIQTRIAEAKQKGITDSLVITEQAALIVSAKNNTVVTAMNRQEANTHIFTNINGTILMD